MSSGPTQPQHGASKQPIPQAANATTSLPRVQVTHHTAAAMAEVTDKLTKMQEWNAYTQKVDPNLVQTRYRTEHIVHHSGGVYSVAPQPDGRFFHSGYEGIKFSFPLSLSSHGRNSTCWKSQPVAQVGGRASTLQRLPTGELVTAGGDGAIHLLSRTDLSWDHVSISGSNEPLFAVQAIPNDAIVSGGADGVLRIHHINDDGEVHLEELPKTAPIRCFQALPDDRIFVGTDDGYLRRWRKDSSGAWRCEEIAAHNGPINCLKVIADGTVVTGGADGIIKVWRSNPHAIHHSRDLKGHTKEVRTLDVLSDLTILSGSSDGTIRLWREKPTPIWHRFMGTTNSYHWSCSVLKGHASDVTCATFMHDGSILSGSLDGTMRIWKGR